MNFFKKFFELQILMLQHNAGLTASHPYASGPINWPFLISGISFWTQTAGQKQIYFIGNLVGWWTCVIGISLYTGIMLADLIARRRDVEPLTEREYSVDVSLDRVLTLVSAVRHRLVNSTGFFVLFWAVHYFPFFLMSRQLFIHHYLPSHVFSAMIAGSVLSFALSETVNYPISIWGPRLRTPKTPTYADLGMRGPIAVGVFSLVMFIMFVYMAPLTYGTPGYVQPHPSLSGKITHVLTGWTAVLSTPIVCCRAGLCTSPRNPQTLHDGMDRCCTGPCASVKAFWSSFCISLLLGRLSLYI